MNNESGWAKMLGALINMAEGKEDYEERKVGRDNVDDMIVSTCYTNDEKAYETAIHYEDKWYPVERYVTKEDAFTGHAKWVQKVPTLDKIYFIGGWDGLVAPKTIKIER